MRGGKEKLKLLFKTLININKRKNQRKHQKEKWGLTCRVHHEPVYQRQTNYLIEEHLLYYYEGEILLEPLHRSKSRHKKEKKEIKRDKERERERERRRIRERDGRERRDKDSEIDRQIEVQGQKRWEKWRQRETESEKELKKGFQRE